LELALRTSLWHDHRIFSGTEETLSVDDSAVVGLELLLTAYILGLLLLDSGVKAKITLGGDVSIESIEYFRILKRERNKEEEKKKNK
jgi:hypothetical protein